MTEIAVRNPVQEVCETIAGPDMLAKIEQALPAGVSLDRFKRATLTAIQQNPEVITANRGSLYTSVIRCAQDGLLPDGREAALVVYSVKGEKKVQYLPMIFGLRKKAAEHHFNLSAYVVYESDEFDYELGMEPTVHHKPPKLSDSRGEPIGAYSVATDKRTGEKYLEVMSLQEIEKVRAVSRAATSEYGPWVKWWDEQARKTVARRLFKQLPLGAISEDTDRVLRAIDDEYDLPKPDVMTVEEANLSVAASAQVEGTPPPDDGGPVDETAVDVEPVQESFEERAARAQATRDAQ